MRLATRGRPGAASGFTLVELLITILLVAEVLVIAGLLFDLHNRSARVQTHVAEMQQSVRVAQREVVETTRMAGRGGLPAHLPPTSPGVIPSLDNGLAVDVDNNVGASFQVVTGQTFTKAVPGTDVLRIRGIFETPIYQILSSALDAGGLVLAPDPDNPASATSGTLTIRSPSPAGYLQDLSHLVPPSSDPTAMDDRALLLVSPLADSIYAVVSVTGVIVDATDASGEPSQVTISFDTTSGTHIAAYRSLFRASGNLPNNLTGVAFAGLLEEHVFYVREQRAIPGDANSELQPKLTRERLHPGTSFALDMDINRPLEDLADNIVDLQVALGFNSNLGSLGYFPRDNLDNLVIEETANGASDDWLFNGVSDNASGAPWTGPWQPTSGPPQPELYYVRISTLARTDGRDREYRSRPIVQIEDRVYGESANAGNDRDRMFRRRLLETVIDLRNI